MRDCPDDLVLFMLLKELPGYTREALEAEPAWLIERWRWFMYYQAQANQPLQKVR